MDKDLQQKISEKLKATYDFEYAAVPKPIKFSIDNYRKFSKRASQAQLCFIDGGNANIIKKQNLSLDYIKVVAVIFEKGQRVDTKKVEFFMLSTLFGKEDNLFIKCEMFTDWVKNIEFDLRDPRLRRKDTDYTHDIVRVSNAIMRFAELKLASEIELKQGDMIMLDGSLDIKYPFEDVYLNTLLQKPNILVVALSKSSTILTKNGGNAAESIFAQGPESMWYYHPIVEGKFETMFAKLHPKARMAFRIDMPKEQFQLADMEKVLGTIAYNSRDAVFPGYPYGLIFADKIARITNNDKEYLRIRFCSKEFPYADLLNAHEILDKVG